MRHAGAALALALLAGAGASAQGVEGASPAPRRVVSMNACTDQLAMLLADEGQLLSVSHLASDPRISAMTAEAASLRQNQGRAEEIFLMAPDLVLAGAYSGREAVAMLRRLGIRVETFEPASGLDDVPARIREVGQALGREAEAETMVSDYDARLAALRAEVARRPRAAIYYANGYTSGDRTLAGQILVAAGFANVAAEAGYAEGGVMPLEVLALAAPEFLVTGQTYPGASRSEAILDHPVVAALRGGPEARIADRDWVCGTPFVLRAVEGLSRLRAGLPDPDGAIPSTGRVPPRAPGG